VSVRCEGVAGLRLWGAEPQGEPAGGRTSLSAAAEGIGGPEDIVSRIALGRSLETWACVGPVPGV